MGTELFMKVGIIGSGVVGQTLGAKFAQLGYETEEILIVQEGRATYVVGSTTLEVRAMQIVIVPPGTPHKFVNSGEGPLRQVDIHVSRRFITEWLEA